MVTSSSSWSSTRKRKSNSRRSSSTRTSKRSRLSQSSSRHNSALADEDVNTDTARSTPIKGKTGGNSSRGKENRRATVDKTDGDGVELKAPVQVEYDSSNPLTPIPHGFKMFARCKIDNCFHACLILESKTIDPKPVKVDAQLVHEYEYYVHFLEFDRRMDDWIQRDNLKLQEQMCSVPEEERGPHLTIPDDLHSNGHGHFSAEDHRAHEEATKVKNVQTIQLGKYEMETWYFSPFPPDYRCYNRMLFCEFCLNFFGKDVELERHLRRCTIRHPPGNEIYRSDEQNCRLSVFEVDGSREIIYCQNLCFVAKLFLDHKTLQYDTEAFLFYVVTEVDSEGCHLAGYFSKEKEPEQQNNLACILTLPCHQRKGYGKFLISLSYELSKIDGKPGSPEKPLSDLGRVSYESYWAKEIICTLNKYSSMKQILSIDDLANMTGILSTDVKETLDRLNIVRYEQGEHVFHVTQSLLDFYLSEKKIDAKRVFVRPCQPSKLRFTSYMLTKGRRVIR